MEAAKKTKQSIESLNFATENNLREQQGPKNNRPVYTLITVTAPSDSLSRELVHICTNVGFRGVLNVTLIFQRQRAECLTCEQKEGRKEGGIFPSVITFHTSI